MIRRIEDGNNLSGEDSSEKWLIKRRLIPIELSVSDTGEYLTFKVKLPYKTKKVTGIIITSDTPPGLDDDGEI